MSTCRRLRVLLTEGSSLSARQTLNVLGPGRHIIDVCDPHPWMCLAGWSRFVRRVHRCPSFAADPAGYLRFLHDRLKAEAYDVLLPVHDQAYLLARYRDQLRSLTGVALPEFEAMERLQSKAGLVRVLDELELPHPPTLFVRSRAELEQPMTFPCYLKQEHGTAGRGVWLVHDRDELRARAEQLEKDGVLDGQTELLVQQPAPGTLSVVQSVFQHGRLVAAHCYQARAQGVGGSAWARIGVDHPVVRDHIARIGAHLNWHGALMFDYLHDPIHGPMYIDANPRIGETFNAYRSGLNLCDMLLRVSIDEPVSNVEPPRIGVKTHSLMMSLLGKANAGTRQPGLLAEVTRAVFGRGPYAGSVDELTRPMDDVVCLLPASLVALGLAVVPRISARRFIADSVGSYALTEAGVRKIRELPSQML